MSSRALFAGIEAGGTKFICAIADARGEILSLTRVPTTGPEETLERVIKALRQGAGGKALAGAGLASFGPIDLDAGSDRFGTLSSTPKPGWSDFDILRAIEEGLGAPTRIDTDVTAAALAEGAQGAAQDVDSHVYVTVGTGIGVGMVSHGRSMLSRGHAEMGHIRTPRAQGDLFSGVCPYHGDCLEGLASGPAMAARWSAPAETLPDHHPAWTMQAFYVACLCQTLIYTVRPERILIGGGVFERAGLIDRVRQALAPMLGGYGLSATEHDLETLIASPALSEPSPGVLGALMLARLAAEDGPGRAPR